MSGKTCGDFGGKKRCTGAPCTQRAGWGTDHPGTGKCKLHGGASKGRPPTHGKYVKYTNVPNALKGYEGNVDHPTLKTIDHEIGLTEKLIQHTLARMASSDAPDWSEAMDALNGLKLAIASDPGEIGPAFANLESVIGRGIDYDKLEAKLTKQFDLKSRLVEKTNRFMVVLGQMIPFREMLGFGALVLQYLQDKATELNAPSLVSDFRPILRRAGLWETGDDAGLDGPAER